MNAELATPKAQFRRPGRYLQRTGQPIVAVSARIPDELLARLAEYGNATGQSLSATIRDLLDRALVGER
jgi:hypothetical protein